MEGIDDDFGDIYADVEVQASTAINGFPNFNKLYTEQDDINTRCSDSDANKVDSIGDELIQSGNDDETKEISSVEANGDEEEIVDNGSDSEDDLNIVLNDDDNGVAYPMGRGVNLRSGVFDDEEEEEGCDFVAVEGNASGNKRKCVDQSQLGDGLEPSSNGTGGGERGNLVKGGYHSQYKYLRYQTTAFPCNSKANGSMGSASYSSTLARGDWDNNGSNQHMGSSSVVTQSGYNFSLPWYRTILDVNIDMFERRPWTHPGADITDFFNFGFDEESWKSYCNCLEQLRPQTSIQTRNLFHEHSEPNEKKASEVGSKHETVVLEAVTENIAGTGQGRTVSSLPQIAYRKMKQSEMPKGRAIQVKDSIAERQPSFNVRRPLDLDSDVVIQISVQDSMKESIDSEEDELGHIDSSEHKASENGDLCVDDNRDIHSFGSPSSDELPRSHAAAPEMCSPPTTASDPVSMDSNDHGSGHISDVNMYHHQKVTICCSVEDAEAKETSNNATRERFGRDICNESSLDKQSQRCPSSSSGNHCETPLDRGSIDPGKIHDNLRKSSSNSDADLRKSITSDRYPTKGSRTCGVKTKSNDCILRKRNRSPLRKDLKNYNRKLHIMPELSELRSYTDDGDASPLSNTDRMYDVDHSTVGCNRKKERLHGLDTYGRKHFSNSRESEPSFNFSGERFSNNQVRTSYRKNPHRKGRQIFGDERDRHLRRKLDEEEYFLEQRLPRVDEVLDGDWYSYGLGHSFDDMGPLTCRESRRMASKNLSSYLENEIGTRWRRRGNELQYGNSMGNNGFSVERRYTDDFMQENFRRSISYNDSERDYQDDKYERHLHSTRREINSSCRGERKYGVPSIDLNSLSMVDEDDYWRCTDHQSLSSHSFKDPDTINGGRWHDTSSVRNDSYEYDLRNTKKHGRVRRHVQTETCGDRDWPGSYSDVFDTEDNINFPDDQIHFERRGHYWHSEVLNWTQNSYISGHRDEKFHAEEASISYRRTSRHKRLDDARNGTDHAEKLIDDGHAEWHKHKILREGYSGIHIDRNSNVTHRGYEQTHSTCRDSVDMQLFVGEGKSSGRRFTARSSICNDKHKNMDRNIYNKQKTFKDSNESHTKAGENDNQEVAIRQNDEKWHDKYPVLQHNEALDIEEGQIITEELNENLVEKECASEAVAPIMDEKRTVHHENASDGNRVAEDYDNHRILAMRAKMEKRRERFKEPIALNKETDKIPNPLADLFSETAETKQQRPVRKRRWGGS